MNRKILHPHDWGLQNNLSGELLIGNFKLAELAEAFDTPLYVLNENVLLEKIGNFKAKAAQILSKNTSVYYPFKCNSVPGIVKLIKQSGLNAEVMTEFELDLAIATGFNPSEIIVNGPCKSESFLLKSVRRKVKLLIVDSLSELNALLRIINSLGTSIQILLRINPGFVPKELNRNSATGSKQSSFGFNERELFQALNIIKVNGHLEFCGIHFHIGTGIRNPVAFSDTIKKISPVIKRIISENFEVKILDVGGGFASMTARELTSFEMLTSQINNNYQLKFGNPGFYSFDDYFNEINKTISSLFGSNRVEIFFEPGRCLVSSAQLLLVKVHRIKKRNNRTWLITDAGLGTLTMPTYYEYHEIFLCNEFNRNEKENVTITGPCCFASDLIYKNKTLPRVNKGEILALMDTGAYFNALESSFNFYKPAIIGIKDNDCRIIRRRETFSDITQRDRENFSTSGKELYNEIHNS